MTSVFTDQDSTRVGFARNILESAGIACFVQNENTQTLGVSLIGFSHAAILDPSLCIVDDERIDEARELLMEHFRPKVETGDWHCTSCNESVPASFDLCWNCQNAKPE